jgi:LemA protein
MKLLGSIGAVIVAILLGVVLTHINSVPTYDENVKEAFSQVQNQYKRRADLIPNLVQTVKAYAQHEKDLFTQVTNARAKAGQMIIDEKLLNDPKAFEKFEKAQNSLSAALGKLMMVSERYPQLKSDKNFLALQSQLEGTENRIAVARKDYIKQVKIYNTELRTIPGKWVASMFYPDAKLKQTFNISANDQNLPKVDL